MEDRFDDFASGISAPATRAVAITPSESQSLPFLPRAIYIGGAGDLATRAEDGSDAVWKNLPAGAVLPFRPIMIKVTGTTATDLLALD